MIQKNDSLLSDEVFQDRGLSGGLPADDSDLGQVDDHGDPQLGEGILHPIDDRDEDLHSAIARSHLSRLESASTTETTTATLTAATKLKSTNS